MKRFIVILFSLSMILLIASCKMEEPETTYTVISTMTAITDSTEVQWDLTAYEYDENEEMTAFNDILRAVNGTKETFIAHSNSAKVKMFFKMYADIDNSISLSYWINQVYNLEKGKNIEIIIEDHSPYSINEPF